MATIDYARPKVIIPLIKSSNANSGFEKNNLIQNKAYEKIIQIIKKNLSTVQLNNSSKNIRFHETITVLGNRGSGKTSFLLNLETMVSDIPELKFLPILDPTLFESKQHVLLTVISVIISEIESIPLAEKDIVYEDKYRTSLETLADGINLLDGIDDTANHKSIWDDTRINFNKGLNDSMKGVSFEKDFQFFISYALKFIKKNMFILMFDDIDTNVDKGWPVLEVIRKYLTLLEIQVIVSGDWTLFSKLVRINQLSNLRGLKDIEEQNDYKKKSSYLITLDTLEDQYLTKILKPENRILIQSLSALINKIDIFIADDITKESDTMENMYRKLFTDSLNLKDEASFDSFKKIFLTLPLRSNIQLLSSFANFKKNGNYSEFIDDIGKQFLMQLTRYGINIHDLYEFKDTSVIYHYIKKSLEIDDSQHDITFRDFLNLSTIELDENQEKNVLFFVLKSQITATINEHKHLLFDWLFKIELLKHYYEKPKLSLSKDLQYLGHGVPTSARQFAQRLNGYLYFQETEKSDKKNDQLFGFAAVYKDKSKKGDKSYEYLAKELKNEDNHILLLLDLMFNKVSLQRNSKSDLYGSLYFLLGSIGELLALPHNKEAISDYFSKKAKIATVLPYSSSNVSSSIYYDQESETNIVMPDKLINDLYEWLGQKNKLEKFPINILEATMKEFYYQESEMPYVDNFAHFITLQTVYFLSALLKAEARHIFHNEAITFKRIKNINTAKDNFSQIYAKYKKSVIGDQLRLFDFIYACPIWRYILEDEHEIKSETPVKTSSNEYGGLFESLEIESTDEAKQEDSNSYYPLMQLLAGLKMFGSDSQKNVSIVQQEDTLEDDVVINTNDSQSEKKYSIDEFTYDIILKIFQQDEEKLNDLKISSKEELPKVYEQYKNYLKTNYFSIQRVSGSRMESLEKAVLTFNNIE